MELTKSDVAVDHKESSLSQLMRRLIDLGAMRYTAIISVSSSDIFPPSVLQYLTPYSGVSLDYSVDDVIFEDMSKQAIGYD